MRKVLLYNLENSKNWLKFVKLDIKKLFAFTVALCQAIFFIKVSKPRKSGQISQSFVELFEVVIRIDFIDNMNSDITKLMVLSIIFNLNILMEMILSLVNLPDPLCLGFLKYSL